ncbi:molybdenum ABC transporter ATP-binding protein [Massilia sp. W12]|uniref:molybdenum ABC transporter ATP-binding protein n=1 Tax=Massilia sp. W12 TaxID=3126507 RepID=UPI0030CD4C66
MTICARFALAWSGFALDVDVRLPGQGVCALFGPSGSGKTTLLRCIAGLERAPGAYLQVGDAVWQDGAHFTPPHQRAIGYVFQDAALFPHLTVQENLQFGLRRSPDAAPARLAQVIDLFGIFHLLGRRPERLSGGERQRVAMARALAVNPRILLLDEPLAALDAARKQEILPYLQRLRDELQIPMLYVSHAADEVLRLADHLLALKDGRMLACGPLAEVLSAHDLPIRLGEDIGPVLQAQVGAFDAQWHLMRLDFAGGSLWARERGLALGQNVRVRILARDVSLATQPGVSTIQNVLPGVVDQLLDDEHPAHMLVRLQVGECFLLARVTRRAAATLALRPGLALWVQIKSVALQD